MTRTIALIILTVGLLIAALWLWNDVPRPYVSPRPLTAAEEKACYANRPNLSASLHRENTRACWVTPGSKIEICYRRKP